MSQENPEEKREEKREEKPQRSRICVELGQLSAKQRGAVLGLLKDIGYTTEEIKEVVIELPEEAGDVQSGERHRGKRK